MKKGKIVEYNLASHFGTIKPSEGATNIRFHLKSVDEKDPLPKEEDSVEFEAPEPQKNKKGKLILSDATLVKMGERSVQILRSRVKSSQQKSKLKPIFQQRPEDDVLRWLPLYQGLGQEGNKPWDKSQHPSANTGLLFDKYCDIWSGPGSKSPCLPQTPKKGRSPKQRFFDEISDHASRHQTLQKHLDLYTGRQNKLVKSLGGESLSFETDWRFVSGLGMGHVLESGFVWHRTLGVPYLPGSSVKGMIRAWAELWGGVSDSQEIKRLFGGKDSEEDENTTGSLIIFDALPTRKPKLEVDIMNPHYAPYYQDNTKPPADYYNPIPIFFLTVAAGQAFQFSLAPRPGAYRKGHDLKKADLEKGMVLLGEAISSIGAGAKTAVGYGYFNKIH